MTKGLAASAQDDKSFDPARLQARCAQDDRKTGARPRTGRPPPRNPHPPPTACRDYVAGGRRRSMAKNSTWEPIRPVNSSPRRLSWPNSPIGAPLLRRPAGAVAARPRTARTEQGSELQLRDERPTGIPAKCASRTPSTALDPTQSDPERPPIGIFGRMGQVPRRMRLQRRGPAVRRDDVFQCRAQVAESYLRAKRPIEKTAQVTEERARGPVMRQIRGIARTTRIPIREPSGSLEDQVPQSLAAPRDPPFVRAAGPKGARSVRSAKRQSAIGATIPTNPPPSDDRPATSL